MKTEKFGMNCIDEDGEEFYGVVTIYYEVYDGEMFVHEVVVNGMVGFLPEWEEIVTEIRERFGRVTFECTAKDLILK